MLWDFPDRMGTSISSPDIALPDGSFKPSPRYQHRLSPLHSCLDTPTVLGADQTSSLKEGLLSTYKMSLYSEQTR